MQQLQLQCKQSRLCRCRHRRQQVGSHHCLFRLLLLRLLLLRLSLLLWSLRLRQLGRRGRAQAELQCLQLDRLLQCRYERRRRRRQPMCRVQCSLPRL